MQKIRKNKGFTLIEILVVIGIIAVLAAIVLIALNPARQFAQARNSQRTSNVNAILNAVGQYIADNEGVAPAGLPTLGNTANLSDGAADLCDDLISEYMPAFPIDPSNDPNEPISQSACAGSYGDTDYDITHESDGRITISAPDTELCSADPCPGGEVISITR